MYIFIVNPISGNGRGHIIWKEIETVLQKKNVEYDVIFTRYRGHATDCVIGLDERKVTAVVAIGGDGTVHDVVNGIRNLPIAFGIIPAGSGNDYARAMGVPKHHLLALDRILSGIKKQMDILFVGEKCCTTVVGIGFDGKVAQLANQSKLKKILNRFNLGKLIYGIIVLQVLFQYRPTSVTMMIDGKSVQFSNVWLIAIANLPYYGGGMNICPEALSDDGYLDVCIVHNISKIKLLQVFPKVFKGKHIHHSAITLMKGKSVTVTSESPVIIHGDGEIIGETPVEVTIQKSMLHIV
ncbi:diacylglycerol/lipid kinase family protein [Alkalihalobacterium bogoriense]|uniref:diacylglycerol/lipid kinase family protein n=1 Tax=Alkalihalobacterium bogoriense TaxID=246272 RepID=UPI0004793B8E|nr:diacylglycerol kinase family protein [Alkalihalobacterium bogoriense]